MEKFGGWCWYYSDKAELLETHKRGKWMHFFNDQEFAMNVCEKAIAENVCHECKCTDMELMDSNTGVICFYLNGDDMENHHKVIQFMMDNKLISKTKTGKLKNMSFKFDDQTRAGQYGADFAGTISLAQFIDLNTGKWVRQRVVNMIKIISEEEKVEFTMHEESGEILAELENICRIIVYKVSQIEGCNPEQLTKYFA